MLSSHPKPNNRHHIANRRSEVWSYLCQGMTRQDIARALKVDASTISRDIAYLTLKSQQYIEDMAKKTLPFMYKKSIEGINEVLKECWHIYLQKDIVPPLFHSISLLFRDIKFIYRFGMRSVRHGDIFVL